MIREHTGRSPFFNMLLRQCVPMMTVLVAVFFMAMPVTLPSTAFVVPGLTLMVCFHWCVYRPDIFTAFHGFVAGFMHDLLLGTSLVVSSFYICVVMGVVASQRKFYQLAPFWVVWLSFLILAFIGVVVQWGLESLLIGQMMPSRVLLFSWAATIGVYPIVGWMLVHLGRMIPLEED
jgi:rod shape-determining protein MreD